jgi:hypothetical protein
MKNLLYILAWVLDYRLLLVHRERLSQQIALSIRAFYLHDYIYFGAWLRLGISVGAVCSLVVGAVPKIPLDLQ